MIEPAYLLDSNICVYVLRDAQCAAAMRIQQCEPGSVVVSAISFGEVALGIDSASPGATASFEALFTVLPVIPFDQDAARLYARLPFRRGTFDRLIGAHALSLGLILVTNNERNFADIPGLTVENWTI